MTDNAEPEANVQVFGVQEVLHPLHGEDYELLLQHRLALAAFDQGFGLVEKPRRKEWVDQSFLAPKGGGVTVVRFRAMAVRLHG